MSLDSLKAHLAPLREKEDALLQRVVDWSNINSGSYHTEGLETMFAVLEEAFSGFDAERTVFSSLPETTGKALSLRCRPEAPLQVFLCGHYDTVYPEDHPFQECRDLGDGRLNGPGVADMKGGILILLEALRILEAFPDKDRLGWEVLLAPDEETGSVGTGPLLDQAAERNHLGLVVEPALTGGDLARARPGSAFYTFTAQGKAAHVGRHYEEGRNALGALVQAATEIQKLTEVFPGAICNLGKFEGGGPLNVVPDAGKAHFNIRVTRTRDAEAMQDWLQDIAEKVQQDTEVKLEFEGSFTRFPKEISDGTQRIFSGLSDCADTLGWKLKWRDTGGCCDGNNLASAGLPVIDNLGVRGGRLHSPDEFLEKDSLVERSELVSLFLLGLASGEIPWTLD